MTKKKGQSNSYDAGARARANGKEGDANPYGTGSSDSKAWEHGYLDRQKVLGNDRRPGGTRPDAIVRALH